MLADHLLGRRVGRTSVVVRDTRPRRDQDVADALTHHIVDVRPEQTRGDRLIACEHPGATGLGLPRGSDALGRAGLGVEVQHPGLSADVPHTGQERVAVLKQDVPAARDIHHAVVGRHENSHPVSGALVQPSRSGIHRLQRGRPLVRFHTALVPDGVELGRVHVDERAIMAPCECRGELDAREHVSLPVELGAAHRRDGEAGAGVVGLGHDEPRRTGCRRQKRSRALPAERIEHARSPVRELIAQGIGARHERAVADKAVLADRRAGQQTRQSAGGRAREDGAGDVLARRVRAEETSVPGAIGEISRPETVDHQDDPAAHRRQAIRGACDRGQQVGHDIGEAPGVRGVRR